MHLEQVGQEQRVVDVGAVRRVVIAAGARVHPDPLPLFLREAIEHQVVQRHPVAEELPGRIELQRQAALGEVDLHAVRALLERATDVGLALRHQVLDERLPWIARRSRPAGTPG